MTILQTLEMALEFISSISPAFICDATHHTKNERHDAFATCPHVEKQKQVFAALRTQIALEKQKPADEPVAYSVVWDDVHCGNFFFREQDAKEHKARLDTKYPGEHRKIVPLYTRPQPADEPLCEVHICDSCGYAYQDSPPSQCDCLGDEQYTKGYIYTRPQPAAQWVGLTDDEIWDVYKKVDSMQYKEFSRAIEAKLKSKNEHQ